MGIPLYWGIMRSDRRRRASLGLLAHACAVTRYDRDFRRIARSLSRLELASSKSAEDEVLDPSMLLGPDREARVGTGRFLGFYGTGGLELAFERYGLYAALARRGFTDPQLTVRLESDRHTLILEAPVRGSASGERVRLLELVVRRDDMLPTPPTGMPALSKRYEVLTIDWLLLQNPTLAFTPERPRLPGQNHPGLGVGWRVLAILYRAAERLDVSGLVTVADHLHNAEHYARELPFFDPAHAGRLRALLELLRVEHRLSVVEASWAMEWGCVKDGKGEAVAWRGEAQVATEDEGLRAYFKSPQYAALAKAGQEACRFTLDRDAFDAEWARARESGLLFPLEQEPTASSDGPALE